MPNKDRCAWCWKPIPEHRKFKLGKKMLTCSKSCSVQRSLTSSKDRHKGKKC